MFGKEAKNSKNEIEKLKQENSNLRYERDKFYLLIVQLLYGKKCGTFITVGDLIPAAEKRIEKEHLERTIRRAVADWLPQAKGIPESLLVAVKAKLKSETE